MAWNGSNGASTPRPTTPANSGFSPVIKGAIAGFIVVVVAIVAFLFLTRSAPEASVEEPEAKPTQIADKGDQVKKSTPLEAEEDDPETLRAKRREMFKKMTPDERLEWLYERAKNTPIDLTPSTNRTFKTGVEQVMSWVFTCRLGNPPPPRPKFSLRDEVHMAEILIADNPILETDSERAADAKECVAAAKKELIKYIKEGGDVDSFIDYYRDQLAEAYHEHTESRKAAIDMLKNGEDPEIVRKFVEKVNEGLDSKGIKRVELPEKIYEKYN